MGRALLGLVPATSGSIRWQGTELVGLSERQLRPMRRRLAMVFQDPNASLNPAMTIGQGVGHPLRIHGITRNRRETRRGWPRCSSAAASPRPSATSTCTPRT